MRGLLSALTREGRAGGYQTGIFIASAAPEIVARVLAKVHTHYPKANFTYVAPASYKSRFEGPLVSFEQFKENPISELRALRKRRFDLCFVISTPGPVFRKPKLAGLLLNSGRIIVYNENGDYCELSRGQWRKFYRQFFGPRRQWRSRATLFFPFGVGYLLARTCYIALKGRLRRAREGLPL